MALAKLDKAEREPKTAISNRTNSELCLIISKLSSLLCELLDLDETRAEKANIDYSLFGAKVKELEAENQRLAKELRDYEILVSCIDLDNFNPALFQKGDDDDEI